jgi:hypothetical protein
VPSAILHSPLEKPEPFGEHLSLAVTADPLATIWRLDAPVAVIMDFVGVGLNQYDELIRDLSTGGSALPGCLFHWARSSQEGVCVTEVWRNIKLFDFFLREEVLPTISALRLPDPELSVYQIHHFLPEGKTRL